MLASRQPWATAMSLLVVATLGGCISPYEPRIVAGDPFVEVLTNSDASLYVPQCRGTTAEIGIYGATDGVGHLFANSVKSSPELSDMYVEVRLDAEHLVKGDAGPAFAKEEFEPFPEDTRTLNDFGTMYYPAWNGRTLRVDAIAALEPGSYRYEDGEWYAISSGELAEALDSPIPECA